MLLAALGRCLSMNIRARIRKACDGIAGSTTLLFLRVLDAIQ